MAVWRYNDMALWCYGITAVWRYGGLAVWRYGSMAVWRYGVMNTHSDPNPYISPQFGGQASIFFDNQPSQALLFIRNCLVKHYIHPIDGRQWLLFH